MRSLHKPSYNFGIEQQLLLSIRLPQNDYASLPNRRAVARRAEQAIRKHPRQQLTIDKICSLVGCSARSLHLGFKECYGTSPGRYARTLALTLHTSNSAISPKIGLSVILPWAGDSITWDDFPASIKTSSVNFQAQQLNDKEQFPQTLYIALKSNNRFFLRLFV